MAFAATLWIPLLLCLLAFGTARGMARQPVRTQARARVAVVLAGLVVGWTVAGWMVAAGGGAAGRSIQGGRPELLLALFYPVWLWLGFRLAGRALETVRPIIGIPRWRGERGRLEVWYATFNDLRTGDGFWIHCETVAPPTGAPYAHGWACHFPAAGAPVTGRFGPIEIASSPPAEGPWFAAGVVTVDETRMRGAAESIRWDLHFKDLTSPLYTFPAWAWESEMLPAAQVVLAPAAHFRGAVKIGERVVQVQDGVGAVARIYGHGNAETWAWLHVDLGDGNVLELVAARSRRRALRWLPVLPLVKMRLGGKSWPADPLLAAFRFRANLDLPNWKVTGRWGRQRLTVEVEMPPASSVALTYHDPDGATATCTNTERANAVITLERRQKRRWELEHQWMLEGTAHAEIGRRP